MLAGRRAFAGDDITETLANVLKTAPDWSSLPPTTPSAVRRLLRRCLEKDPHERQRSIADARLEILDAIRHPDVAPMPPAVAVPSAGPKARRMRLWLQAGGLVVIVAIAAIASWSAARWQTSVAPASLVRRLAIVPSAADAISIAGSSRDLAISPDGKRVAYVGGNATALMIRELDRVEAVRLDVGGVPHAPFFSPDGTWVGFVDGLNALRRVPIGGGAVETICRIMQPGIHPNWGGDSIVFAMNGALFRVPATGGAPERIAPASSDLPGGLVQPTFLPGNNAVLFAKTGKDPGIAVLDLKSGTTKTVISGGSFINFGARYLASGHLIYMLLPYIGGGSSIGRTYDVSPDGERFLMIKPDGPPATIVAVLNWHEELKRLVPTRQQAQ